MKWEKLDIEVISFRDIEKAITVSAGSWCKTDPGCGWVENGTTPCFIPHF